MDLPNIYAGNYKRLIVVPLALILASFILIATIGIPQGVELKGGVLITLQLNGSFDKAQLTSSLAGEGIKDVSLKTYENPVGNVLEIEIDQNEQLSAAEKAMPDFNSKVKEAETAELDLLYADERARLNATPENVRVAQDARVKNDAALATVMSSGEAILDTLEQGSGTMFVRNATDVRSEKKLVDDSFTVAKEQYRRKIVSAIGQNVHYSSYSFQDVSPTLSAYFLSKAFGIVLISALLTAIAVFAIFRTFVPSVAVLAGAASDVIIAMGAMALFQIPLTLPSFAALLMLIGFSLDTDLLLTIRTLKRGEGTARERAYDTMKTGATMSAAALVAFGALFILALITHIPTYYQISAVAICGLAGDLIATWGLNAVIILWYAEKKEHAS